MMKRTMKLLLLCCVMLQLVAGAVAATSEASSAESQHVLPIESAYFFNYIGGTVYIYFGHPDAPECVEFEPHLTRFLAENDRVVYFYDTAHWKEHPQYDQTLARFQVEDVPVLVKTVDGEYRDSYHFDSQASAQEIATQLEEFIVPRSSLFPVTEEHDFPIQFHSKMLTFTFFIMCVNAGYLLWKGKSLASHPANAPLLWVFLNSTLLLALHFSIAGFGFAFSMQYEANPATGLMAWIGTNTWLIVTPLLYCLIIYSSIKIKVRQHDLRMGKENP